MQSRLETSEPPAANKRTTSRAADQKPVASGDCKSRQVRPIRRPPQLEPSRKVTKRIWLGQKTRSSCHRSKSRRPKPEASQKPVRGAANLAMTTRAGGRLNRRWWEIDAYADQPDSKYDRQSDPKYKMRCRVLELWADFLGFGNSCPKLSPLPSEARRFVFRVGLSRSLRSVLPDAVKTVALCVSAGSFRRGSLVFVPALPSRGDAT